MWLRLAPSPAIFVVKADAAWPGRRSRTFASAVINARGGVAEIEQRRGHAIHLAAFARESIVLHRSSSTRLWLIVHWN
eukprot:1914682-Prymnesium_polylepis.1